MSVSLGRAGSGDSYRVVSVSPGIVIGSCQLVRGGRDRVVSVSPVSASPVSVSPGIVIGSCLLVRGGRDRVVSVSLGRA